MSKIHYLNIVNESEVPYWEENKQKGYKVSICGYQRKETTLDKNKVTCKHCLKLIG